MALQIRPLRERELHAMTRVWELAGLPYRPTGRDSLESLQEQRKAFPDLFMGAFIDETLVGVAIASDDGRKGWINRLAVIPEARRHGIGTAIVEECERALRTRGRGVFSILIEGENQASEDLFLKMGYKLEEYIKYYAKRDSQSV
jgi:ribosomal protein S18 acetylase RimI-like enzyme